MYRLFSRGNKSQSTNSVYCFNFNELDEVKYTLMGFKDIFDFLNTKMVSQSVIRNHEDILKIFKIDYSTTDSIYLVECNNDERRFKNYTITVLTEEKYYLSKFNDLESAQAFYMEAQLLL